MDICCPVCETQSLQELEGGEPQNGGDKKHIICRERGDNQMFSVQDITQQHQELGHLTAGETGYRSHLKTVHK